jgi:2-polyprenyl-3-methyl-5-hydroxy-6-metoxy-1,4-benzoquinol methylase
VQGRIGQEGFYDDRYGYPGRFSLRGCAACGHKWLDAPFSPEQLGELYTAFYPRTNLKLADFASHQEVQGFAAWMNGNYATAFRWVPRGVRILDIGCGFGNTLAYHQARGCDVWGVEADKNIRRVADKFGFRVHVGLFDDSLYKAEFFDYVTMDQVIEHVTDPVGTLRGVARILKPGGTAVLSTPNSSGWGATVFGRRWINWHAPYHLQFFSQASMQLAAQQAGLIVERSMTITPSAWLHYQWLHLLTYPSEGAPSIFWAPGGTWSFMKRIGRKAFSIIHRCKVDHVITRVFDALGVGDNRLFFLRKP